MSETRLDMRMLLGCLGTRGTVRGRSRPVNADGPRVDTRTSSGFDGPGSGSSERDPLSGIASSLSRGFAGLLRRKPYSVTRPFMRRISLLCVLATNLVVLSFPFARDTRASTDDWPRAQGDARRSGHAPSATLPNKLGLLGTIRATDSILASPVVADGRVFVIDASGVVIAANVDELEEIWRVDTTPLIAPIAKRRTSVDPSGGHNVGNIAAPAVAGEHLHVGTVGGVHFVLRAATGEVVRAIDCGEPIFSSPVVTERGVYVATLGSRLLALDPDGAERFRWDFVRERLGFDGDRWDGAAWAARGKRATWRDQFLCSRDLAVAPDGTIVLPAGGAVVWLADKGDRADFLAEYRGSRES